MRLSPPDRRRGSAGPRNQCGFGGRDQVAQAGQLRGPKAAKAIGINRGNPGGGSLNLRGLWGGGCKGALLLNRLSNAAAVVLGQKGRSVTLLLALPISFLSL